jgi:hypothetical protein
MTPVIECVFVACVAAYAVTVGVCAIVIATRIGEVLKVSLDISEYLELERQRRLKIWRSRKINNERQSRDIYRPRSAAPQELERVR